MTEQPKKKSGKRFMIDSTLFWGGMAFIIISVIALYGGRHGHGDLTGDKPASGQQIYYSSWRKPSVAGLYLAARHASHDGDDNFAVQSLKLALEEHPDDLMLLDSAFDDALIAGDIDSAVKFSIAIRKVLENKNKIEKTDSKDDDNSDDPAVAHADYSMVYLVAAVERIKNGDMAAASKILDQGDEYRSASPLKRMMVDMTEAWVAYAKGGAAAGIAAMDPLEGYGDIRPFLRFHGALMLSAAGDYKRAEAYFDDALAGLSSPPRRVAELYANVLHIDGKNSDADKILSNFWQHNRDIWLEPDEINGEVMVSKPIIANEKDGIAELFYGASGLVHQDGEGSLAYQFLNLAIYLKPDMDIAKVLLAAYYEREKLYDDVISTYSKIDEKSPFWKRAQMEIATAEAVQNPGSNHALARLDKVISKFPDSPMPWMHKGDILRQHEKYSAAADAYSKAIERIKDEKPYNWPVFYMRGICYERSKQWNLAEPDFKKALELSPDNPEVLNYLAYSWLDMNINVDEAKKMLEKAVAMRPDEGHIVDSMGWAYFRRAEYDDAIPYLERAVELLPNDVTVNDHLGDLYWKLGREREAEFQWQRALKNDPDEAEKAKIEQKLKSGI